MKRKSFLKSSLAGLGAIVGIPTALSSCVQGKNPASADGCEVSPSETAGPFPIKTPAELVRANIISDRKGVALLINFTIQDTNNDCQPLAGAFVDIWHCDSEGLYSEYGGEGSFWQKTDLSEKHFLRGRQTTDANGQVSFISIYPGWYPGRAPHIHVEVLDSNEKSLLVTQVAFPDDVSNVVYATAHYQGAADTTNVQDGLFDDSLEGNMSIVNGNNDDGYTLVHMIKV